MPKPMDYGIIYNWDGAPHGYSGFPQSMEQFLAKVYAPMEDTQVGAHFWCVGEHQARWKSDVLEQVGDVHGRQYESPHSYAFNENIRAMLDRGEDPQKELISRGHDLGMHVYASVRMNDNHFNGAQVEDLPTMRSSELTRMRIEHPQWLLGEKTTGWFALSWNFEVPEVREHRYKHIAELCRRYDWDGVELDWQRHAFHLPADHGFRLRYLITDLMQAVRELTNELAEKRGRPFYIAARVAPTLETSHRIGYDVRAWIDEGLVDILIPAGGYGTDPSIAVKTFAGLCSGTDVALYPGLDVRLSTIPSGTHSGRESHVGPEDPLTKDTMLFRAEASRHRDAGADGVYIFNWHSDQHGRRQLLSEIGAPETMRQKDKIYAATPRSVIREGPWRGATDNDRIWGEVPVPLKPTLTGDGPTITLQVADDTESAGPTSIVLRLRLENWFDGDAVRVNWDGVELHDLETRYHIEEDGTANPFGAPVMDWSGAVWLSTDLTAQEAGKGAHTVKAVLERRNPRLAVDIILTDVELVIRYGES